MEDTYIYDPLLMSIEMSTLEELGCQQMALNEVAYLACFIDFLVTFITAFLHNFCASKSGKFYSRLMMCY